VIFHIGEIEFDMHLRQTNYALKDERVFLNFEIANVVGGSLLVSIPECARFAQILERLFICRDFSHDGKDDFTTRSQEH
jgi:hypothetical protein